MNFYFLIGTVSLVIQLAILGLLIVGVRLKQQLSFRKHGFTMLSALAVHIVTIAGIMLPSFLAGLIPIISKNPESLSSLSSIFMAATGAATVVLGIWIVGGWRLRQSTKFCAPKKKFMFATIILWLISLFMGILLYLSLNWSILSGLIRT